MSGHNPRLLDLVRIIVVAQSQTQDDTTLAFLSIDCYTDGWVANLRVIAPEPHGYPVFMFFPQRDPDPATHYGGRGASLHRLDHGANWYISFVFFPALRTLQSPLEFNVPMIRFTDRPRNEGGALVAETPGPWRFVVPVADGMEVVQVEPTKGRWQPSYLEQRRRRQQETLPIYGPVFDDILDIFYRFDPMIAWLDPSGVEWYTPVTYMILGRLPQARSATDVKAIVLDEFRKRWKSTFHEESLRSDEMAELIWQAWQRRQIRA